MEANSSSEPPSPLPPTEQRLAESMDLDQRSTVEVLQLLNDQDFVAVQAVREVLPQIATLVDIAAERIRAGGTVHYFGAGTSGRLAVLDAAELLPTFNVEPHLVQAHIAGGERAFVHAVENAEDSVQEGAQAAAQLTERDVAIGITASGNTPYVAGALAEAKSHGAYTALISSNPGSQIAPHVELHVMANTGPEVVTGSTRLKAGTAEKLILNGFSTALMVKLGRTWENLMVSMVATNEKLRQRTVRIMAEATGLDDQACREQLELSDGELKTAIVSVKAGVTPQQAREALTRSLGSVRDALNAVAGH